MVSTVMNPAKESNSARGETTKVTAISHGDGRQLGPKCCTHCLQSPQTMEMNAACLPGWKQVITSPNSP